MKTTKALEGGLAGAIALTIVHEGVKRILPNAPRMDLLGMNALSKGLKSLGANVPGKSKLYGLSLAGDLISNALFYSLAGVGGRKYLLLRGALLGLTAGAGAVTVPKYTALEQRHSSRTKQTSTLTVAWYLVGGLVAGAAMLALSRRKEKRKISRSNDLHYINPAESRMSGFIE